MTRQGAKAVLVMTVLAMALAMPGAAEAKKKKGKAPPPPPPAPVIVIPPQPRPPLGAPSTLNIPQRDALGKRRTVNTAISAAQTTWNLRSAYNVAALSCMQPQHAQILVNYRAFLKTHARTLATANRLVDGEFRAKSGARYVAARESYMTQVYNYFALPPTINNLCDTTLGMLPEAVAVKSVALNTFSAAKLPVIDKVFLDFYDSYDQYRTDLAAWQARYAPSQPQVATTVAAPVPTPGQTAVTSPGSK